MKKQTLLLFFWLLVAPFICGQKNIFVNPTVATSGNGTDWTSAYSDLQSAIDGAESGDTLRLAVGTYQTTGSKAYEIKKDIIIIGGYDHNQSGTTLALVTNDTTRLKGAADNRTLIIAGKGTNINVTLKNLIIENGNASIVASNVNDQPVTTGCGGGIYNTMANTALHEVTIQNNIASTSSAVIGKGGGIYNENGALTIINSSIRNNIASTSHNGQGGGTYNGDNATITFSGSTITGNTASSSIIIRDLTPVNAASSFDFVNSIGVNSHIGYPWTNYHRKWEMFFALLKESGIKHIRDGYGIFTDIEKERFIAVGEAGIKLLLCAQDQSSDILLKEKIEYLLPMLYGVEAVNEGDFTIDGIEGDPEVWVPILQNLQKDLWDLIKGNPETDHLPVVGASFANPANFRELTQDMSDWMDYGNIHSYAGFHHPALNWGVGLTRDGMFNLAKLASKDKPIIATECGYNNYSGNIGGHLGVPESVDAIYTPHLLFEYFNSGVVRTYLYEFLDLREEGVLQAAIHEHHFGMVDSTGRKKPVFHAIKNLITLLDDVEGYTANPLEYELIYDALPDKESIGQTLLQKSDGSWWIAVYRIMSVFNNDERDTNFNKLDCTPIEVTLNLDRRAKDIKLYRPNDSEKFINSFQNQHEITFDLDDRILLIRIER